MFKKIALLSLGVYAVVSGTLFFLPILRKDWKKELKKKFPYSVTVIAHRGGSSLGPENTVYTFEKAMKDGRVDMLELDVHQSKDGKAVVIHDNCLLRTCGNDLSVSDIVVGSNPDVSLPQSLRKIPIFYNVFSSETTGIPYEADENVPVDSTTRVCLLTEVFDKFKGVPLHIDIKEDSYAFVKLVLDLIEEHHRESITFIGSSNSKNRKHIKHYFKSCTREKRQRYRLFGDEIDYWMTHLYFRLGLLPFVSIDYDVFSIPIHIGMMRRECETDYGKILPVLIAGLLTSPLLWRYLQCRGVAVVGWVFNDECDIKEVAKLPLNGVMSDYPIKLSTLLQNTDHNLNTLS